MPMFDDDVLATLMQARNARWAVYARRSPADPWVQVESIMGRRFAQEYASDLQHNEMLRDEAITDSEDDVWDDMDQPVDPPIRRHEP